MGASTFVVKIAKRGSDMPGLMRYLYGPGRGDVHTDQHMIAGTPTLHFGFEGALTPGEATELGRDIEASWRLELADARVAAGIGVGGIDRGPSSLRDDRTTPDVAAAGAPHVYHFILSLPPGAQWTDEQFATVAGEYVKRLGFTDGDDDDLGCRWVAVRHGLSRNGNEHVHVAVNLVRQDGRRTQVPHNDFGLAQRIRRDLERELDFVLPLHDRDRTPGRSIPAYTMAEHHKALAADAIAPDRVLLAQHLRAAATASSTEAQWIRAVRDLPGVQVGVARWKPGGMLVASGYTARIGGGPRFKASDLAPDLTLDTMRVRWAANETEQSRADAAALWHTAAADTITGAGPLHAITQHIDAAEAALELWADDLTQHASQRAARPGDLAFDDMRPDARHDTRDDARDDVEAALWDDVSADLAGITAALTVPIPTREGGALPDSQTTDPRTDRVAVMRAAQLAAYAAVARQHPVVARPAGGPTRGQIAARQVAIAMRAGGLHTHPGWVAVLQQMARVSAAVSAARQARGELAAAQRLTAITTNLTTTASHVHATYGNRDLDGLRDTWEARENAHHTQSIQATAQPTPGRAPTPGATARPAAGRTPYLPRDTGRDYGRGR